MDIQINLQVLVISMLSKCGGTESKGRIKAGVK